MYIKQNVKDNTSDSINKHRKIANYTMYKPWSHELNQPQTTQLNIFPCLDKDRKSITPH